MSTSREPSGPSPLPKAAPAAASTSLKGWEVSQRRRRAHNDALVPRMRDLWLGGSSHAEIADALNDEGIRNSAGSIWTAARVGAVLRAGMDRAEYDDLVARSR